jgi:hypothetical protein
VVKIKHVFLRVTTPRIRQHFRSLFGSPRFEFRPGHHLRGCGCLWFSSVSLEDAGLVPPNTQHRFLPRPFQTLIH